MAAEPISPSVPVLLLAYVYPPYNYTGAARPHRLAKYLERIGHEVTVITAHADDGAAVEKNVLRLRGNLDHAPTRSPGFYLERLLRLANLWPDEGLTWVPRAVRAAAARKFDRSPVVISTSPPLTVHLAASRLKKRFGWKWIADFRDPFVGNPFRKGPVSKRTDPIVEREFFRCADLLIANTDAVSEMWLGRYPQHREKIRVLWNGFDPEDAVGPAPLPVRDFRVLAHVGDIYGARHPELVLRSFYRLLRRGSPEASKVRIQLVGSAAPSPAVDCGTWEFLAARGCLDFRANRVPRREADRLIAEADFLLLLGVVEPPGGLQVPAKIFDYVRIGRPILLSTLQGSPAERLLSRAGVPYTAIYPTLPDEEIDRRVESFLRLPSEPARPSDWFMNTFEAEAQATLLSTWLKGLETMAESRK